MFIQVTDIVSKKKVVVNTKQIISIKDTNGVYMLWLPSNNGYDLKISETDCNRVISAIGAGSISGALSV